MIPQASISESISAPTATPNPRSEHKATRWTWGIDIATQQATPANINITWICKGLNFEGNRGCWISAEEDGLFSSLDLSRMNQHKGVISKRQIIPIQK